MGINTAEYILIFGAFLPIMVITALIINTVPILSNRFLSFAVMAGIVIIYGWYEFKAENILKKMEPSVILKNFPRNHLNGK